MPKIHLRPASAPNPAWEANSAPPDIAGFKGHTSKGRGGHRGSTGEGRKKEGERKGEGKGEWAGKGAYWYFFFPTLSVANTVYLPLIYKVLRTPKTCVICGK